MLVGGLGPLLARCLGGVVDAVRVILHVSLLVVHHFGSRRVELLPGHFWSLLVELVMLLPSSILLMAYDAA